MNFRADQLNKCQKATNSPLCTRKELLKYTKQADSKNITSEASISPIVKGKIEQQKTYTKPEDVSKNKEPSNGIKSSNLNTAQNSKIIDKMEATENSSSRKTSSSSNGSNSTSDSSSSFSSHPLKTLPENPDFGPSSKSKNVMKKDSEAENNKSLLWQDDPGQLLNAWLGELDSLQKVRYII